MEKNTRNRNWILTIPSSIINCEVDKWLETRIKGLKVSYALSVEETGEDTGYLHYHLLLKFENAVFFNSLKKIFDKCHIEEVIDFNSALNYVSKCGLLICTLSYQKNEDIVQCVLNDIEEGKSLKYIIYKYPKFSFYHFSNLKAIYDFINIEKNRNRF